MDTQTEQLQIPGCAIRQFREARARLDGVVNALADSRAGLFWGMHSLQAEAQWLRLEISELRRAMNVVSEGIQARRLSHAGGHHCDGSTLPFILVPQPCPPRPDFGSAEAGSSVINDPASRLDSLVAAH